MKGLAILFMPKFISIKYGMKYGWYLSEFDKNIKEKYPSLYKLKMFVPGDSFGELSLLTGASRAGTVISQETCYFVTIDKPTFNVMMKNFH